MPSNLKIAIFFFVTGVLMFLSSAFLANLWMGLSGMAVAFTSAFYLEKMING